MFAKEEACLRCGAETEAQGFYYEMQHCTACLARDRAAAALAESVVWKPAAELPDADTTFMLFDAAASEPVWPGYYDGERWRYADGMPATPTDYADMLKGPRAMNDHAHQGGGNGGACAVCGAMELPTQHPDSGERLCAACEALSRQMDAEETPQPQPGEEKQ